MPQYYVYIMTNVSRTLYIGVTTNLERRILEHKQKLVEGFTKQYNITMLAYYEVAESYEGAIGREKQLKRWLQARKIALAESMNPSWLDLSAEWFGGRRPPVVAATPSERDSSVARQR
ncbi:MAG: GIY-YIG nuclease family protein [Dehalococcoidia bacterium]|nr:GIY-YIG nuclease family protein [Dehalococcoidia bacterium]